MIRILQEITDWGEYNISNGTYYVNEHGHLVAYKPVNGEYKEFSKPMKRFSTTEEIAEFVFFLGSDSNTYISNQVLSISGGE